ncbi:carbamoyl-phosphate synthase (glutamine-hydrolyzing) cpa2 [Elasticomyces elasticus]|nr:carbamoyl-phosphate synthase (glutamine-hydrolyzing) cpa2 [Elasticomyces elasticus]KAK4970115.1 hypothetical protein LTR42_008282 [Elasticomyces elasticus]
MDSRMAAYIVWLVWTCITQTPARCINQTFATIFTAHEIIAELLEDSMVAFAPGLLDVLQSATPPGIDVFKRLPTNGTGRWGVYLVVLEKAGRRPRIYIGSGTQVVGGVASRWQTYARLTGLPRFVQRAIDEGYTITHVGLLCWASIPAPAVRFPLRSLFLALEATFSVLLWAMVSRTKSYGLPNLCPWDLDAIEYDGCCSHTALAETVVGEEEGLTLEQIAAKAVLADARRSEQRRINRSKSYYALKLKDFDKWQAQIRAQDARRDPEALRISKKKSSAKAKAGPKFNCDPCGLSFKDSTELNKHNATQRHLNKISGKVVRGKDAQRFAASGAIAKAAKRFHCACCDHAFNTKQHLTGHFTTQKHIDKATAAASGLSSS